MQRTVKLLPSLRVYRWLQEDGLPATWLLSAFVLVVLLIFLRRPGDLLHAQFYAEDGLRWFAQAYNLHWLPSLPIPDAGYLQVLPRLFAGLALWVPLERAPLVLNLAGAALQALPVVALLSYRCTPWGPLSLRLIMAAVYLASPNVNEIHVNITNAQWHLGLLQVLLAFGVAPRTTFGKVLDVAVFLVGSISGPFDLVLLPVVLLASLRTRPRWTLVPAACMACGSLLQLKTLATGALLEAFRPHIPVFTRSVVSGVPLGATPALFVRIVGGCVFLDSMLGYSKLDRTTLVIPLIFFLLGGLVVGFGLYRSPAPFRWFALYAAILFGAALSSPVILDSVSRWHGLSTDAGMRYYFFPALVFTWSALYVLYSSSLRWVRWMCLFVFLLFAVGLRKWTYDAYPVSHLDQYARRLKAARVGENITMPIYPKPWTMTLTKRP